MKVHPLVSAVFLIASVPQASAQELVPAKQVQLEDGLQSENKSVSISDSLRISTFIKASDDSSELPLSISIEGQAEETREYSGDARDDFKNAPDCRVHFVISRKKAEWVKRKGKSFIVVRYRVAISADKPFQANLDEVYPEEHFVVLAISDRPTVLVINRYYSLWGL